LPHGGGVSFGAGNHRISNSTFSGKAATALTGTGGGVFNEGTLTVVNSTFTGNIGNETGGALSNEGISTVRNVTISNNRANRQLLSGGGGGIISGSRFAPSDDNQKT
jgi:alcohol dehydrogenase YqhD (iron-dependent ADH family)